MADAATDKIAIARLEGRVLELERERDRLERELEVEQSYATECYAEREAAEEDLELLLRSLGISRRELELARVRLELGPGRELQRLILEWLS